MADRSLAAALAAPRKLPNVVVLYGSDARLIDAGATAILDIWKQRLGARRLDSLAWSALQQDPALLLDRFATRGLFDDPAPLHVVDVAERGAGVLVGFLERLEAAPERDAVLISSTTIRAKSAILDAARRSRFVEAISCYDSGLDAASLRARLASAGLAPASDAALERLLAVLEAGDPGQVASALQQLALFVEEGAAFTAEDVDACLGGGGLGDGADLAEALLAGDRATLIGTLAARQRLGEDPGQALATLGRTLADLSSGLAALEGRPGGRKPFWKTERALKSAARALPDLGFRLERAEATIHEAEYRLRSSAALPEAELERAALTVSAALAPTSRARPR